jgi:hypothetical protein
MWAHLATCCIAGIVSLRILDCISNSIIRHGLHILYTFAIGYVGYCISQSEDKAILGRNFDKEAAKLLYHRSHRTLRQLEEIDFEFVRRPFRESKFRVVRVWGTPRNGRKSFYMVFNEIDYRARVAEMGEDWVMVAGRTLLNSRILRSRTRPYSAKF